MPFSICCCRHSKKATKQISGNNSPNVIDVYIDPFNNYVPITKQPVQSKPRQSLNDNLIHDLKIYENEPKGFNNFAFVDEIDVPVKYAQENILSEIKKLDLKRLKENSNQSLRTTVRNDNLNESKNVNSDLLVENIAKEVVITESFINEQNTTPSLCENNKNNNCTLTIITNGEKTVQTFDIDNINTNLTIDNSILIHPQNSHTNINLNDSSTNNDKLITVSRSNNGTVTIIKDGTKTVENLFENSPFYNKNNNYIQIDNITINNGKILINSDGNSYGNYIIQNAFQNFIENSGLKPHLENINYNMPIENYATMKIQSEYLMKAIEVPRKIPKRKFPHAFDKKFEKANDLKRKPPTNLIISKVQLLKEIQSDYCYASFRLSSLVAHNEFRANHGCPPLIESNELNEIAKDWANHLAINNYEICHRPNNKFGENLYWTTNPFGHAKMAVQAWYNEIELYDYYNPGFSLDTGHFTQVLWKETKELGTAIAKIGNTIWVVCNYNPPGNVQGRFNDFYVPRPIK